MEKDDATWLKICYVVFGILVAYVAYKFIYTIGLQFGWTERYDEWYPAFNNIVAIACGGLGVYCISRDPEQQEYYLASIGELRKVKWPTPDDTKKMTVIVAVVVAIFSVILTVFDMAWSKALQFILP